VSYRRRATPLHAARASAGGAYCVALALAALLLSNPVALAALIAAVGAAGVAAGLGTELRRVVAWAVAFAIVIAAVNALVTRDGLTVIVRLGQLPVLGHTDVTLEASVYGGVLGMRAIALILCGAVYTGAIDPDELLGLFRRVSFRSALTATIATRMVPMLVRDSRRLADAQRCRPGRPPSRTQLLRAAGSGVLDRALDVAAALEVRGYGVARKPPRATRPYSRHDVEFTASAIAIALIAILARVAGLAPFQAYPSLRVPVRGSTVAVGAALLLCALLPFADRRGTES
jgi:energy-coupling factor transport system permease protein